MDLIIEEQTNGYGASIQGKDWTDPEIFETTLAPFIAWIERTLAKSGIRLESCDDPTKIIMYLYRGASRTDTHRLTITCENGADRDELLDRLKSYFGLEPEAPAEDAGDEEVEAEDYWGGQHATFV